MSNFIIEDDRLIRSTPIYRGNGWVDVIENKLVITKDEFLACYNRWVKEEKNEDANRLAEADKKGGAANGD